MLEDTEVVVRDNRRLRDELTKLRPMARLAMVISLMEGENAGLHRDLTASDRDLEDLKVLYRGLEARVEALEKGLIQSRPPGGGINPR